MPGPEITSDAELIETTERWFLARGIPHFIEDYRATDDVFTRALPVLALVFLVELLGAANLESLLDAWVRPDVPERVLLSPPRYRAAMDGVLQRLTQAADARRPANPRAHSYSQTHGYSVFDGNAKKYCDP